MVGSSNASSRVSSKRSIERARSAASTASDVDRLWTDASEASGRFVRGARGSHGRFDAETSTAQTAVESRVRERSAGSFALQYLLLIPSLEGVSFREG